MADNYLEKRMEDYLRAKRAAGNAKPARSEAHDVGKQQFRNKKICIVACDAEEEGLTLASRLREKGAAVAVFIDERKMAEQFVNIGARVYCVEPDDAEEMAEKFADMMRHYFNLTAVCNLSPRIPDAWFRAAIARYESSLPLPPAAPARVVSSAPEDVLHILAQFVKNKF